MLCYKLAKFAVGMCKTRMISYINMKTSYEKL